MTASPVYTVQTMNLSCPTVPSASVCVDAALFAIVVPIVTIEIAVFAFTMACGVFLI